MMTSSITITETLTDNERDDLNRCERQIAASFMTVGLALREIRDKRLYREYGTFDEYCQSKWAFTRQRANQLIGGADVAKQVRLATGVDIPNENTARALKAVPEEYRATVARFANAVAENEGKPLNSGHVKAVAETVVQAGETGYVDDEDGNPLSIAIKADVQERRARQRQHINEDRTADDRAEYLFRQALEHSDDCARILAEKLYAYLHKGANAA